MTTTPTYAAANLQWLGVAAEATYGEAEALPSLFVPVETPVWTHPTEKLVDMGLRGAMATEFGQINGTRHDQVTFKTNLYLDSLFFFLRSALGLADQVSGLADPYTHKTSLLSGNNGQPQGTTVFWYDAAGKAWQMPGAQISGLKFTIKTGALVDVDVTYVGMPAVPIAPPTNTPTSAAPAPSWAATITLAGQELHSFSEVDIDIKRATEMIPVLNGTQNPLAIFAGPVSVSGTLNAVYQGSLDQNLVNELTNEQPPLVIECHPVGDAVHGLSLQMSQVAYDASDPAGTNKWMEIKSTIKALANTTDVASGGSYSPLLASMTSPIATAI